jgi:hypothetical protein
LSTLHRKGLETEQLGEGRREAIPQHSWRLASENSHGQGGSLFHFVPLLVTDPAPLVTREDADIDWTLLVPHPPGCRVWHVGQRTEHPRPGRSSEPVLWESAGMLVVDASLQWTPGGVVHWLPWLSPEASSSGGDRRLPLAPSGLVLATG